MGNTQLPFHRRCSFIDVSQEDVAEVEGPDAIVDLLEPMHPLLETAPLGRPQTRS
jgi:hypothetical protein